MLKSKDQINRHKRATSEVPSDPSTHALFRSKKPRGRQSPSGQSTKAVLFPVLIEEPAPSSSQSDDGTAVFPEAISSSQEANDIPTSSLAPNDILTLSSFQPSVALLSPELTTHTVGLQDVQEDTSPLDEITRTFVASIETLFKYANMIGSQEHEMTRLFDLIGMLCDNHSAKFPPTMAVAKILTQLGTGYLQIGELVSAEKTLQFALSLYDKLGDINSYELARTWHNLGGVAYRLGNFPSAKDAFDKARDICKQKNDPHLLYINLMALAMVLHRQGHFEEAKHTYDTCFKLQESYTDQTFADLNRIDSLTELGDLYSEQGKLKEANQYYESALLINPNSLNHARALVSQSRLPHITPEQALILLNTSLSIKQQLGDEEPLGALTGLSYARAYLASGYLKDATALLKSVKTLQILAKEVDKPLVAEMLILEGELSRHKGHIRQSIRRLTSALEMATHYYGVLRPVLFGKIHLALAKTYQSNNNLVKAYEESGNALAIFEQYTFDTNHPWMRDALDIFTTTALIKDRPSPILSSSSSQSFWESPLAACRTSATSNMKRIS